jgi:hypothetical protein
MLIEIHRWRLAGCAGHHDAIGAFSHVKVDKAAKTLQIKFPFIVHGRNDSNQAASYWGFMHGIRSEKALFYLNLSSAKNIPIKANRYAAERWHDRPQGLHPNVIGRQLF